MRFDETVVEFALTPKTGNPDLVISIDPRNKFPTRKKNNFKSVEQFETDSIIIDREMINDF